MADVSPLEILAVPPSLIDLSATYDFQPVEVAGVSFAVDPDALARIAAAAEVARLRIADAIPCLLSMLSQDRTSAVSVIALSTDDQTAAHARKATNTVRFAEADQACQAAAAAALGAMGPIALQALTDALMARNPNRRLGAASALGHMGADAEPAVHALAAVAKADPADTVRTAATEALKRIKPRKWFSL